MVAGIQRYSVGTDTLTCARFASALLCLPRIAVAVVWGELTAHVGTPYIVVYRLSVGVIEVLRILHGKQVSDDLRPPERATMAATPL